MKIRQGFVSNSSSSSFVVCWKGDLKKELELAFQVPDNHILKEFTTEIAKTFFNCLNDKNKKGMTFDKYLEDYNYGEEELSEEALKIKSWVEQGYKLATGSFSDESYGGGIEATLCDLDHHYDSENLKIIHYGGY